jgi:hypothetical protein
MQEVGDRRLGGFQCQSRQSAIQKNPAPTRNQTPFIILTALSEILTAIFQAMKK